jgi:nucleotide-binding universal stress UspA family protein
MPAPHWKPRVVLVAWELSDEAPMVVDAGLELAAAEDAEIVFLQVVDDDWRVRRLGPAAMAVRQQLTVDESDTALRKAEASAAELGVRSRELLVASDRAAEEIVDVARKVHADLVVVPAHRRTLAEVVFGDVATSVVRHAEQPVLIIRRESSVE